MDEKFIILKHFFGFSFWSNLRVKIRCFKRSDDFVDQISSSYLHKHITPLTNSKILQMRTVFSSPFFREGLVSRYHEFL